nr:hypothetical protein [Amycolatopsis palatopharyngis]
MAVLSVIVVLATVSAVWSGLRAGELTAGDPAGNVAFVDDAATNELREQVGAAVKALFSYDYSNLARTERAADSLLVGDAVVQYESSFAAAREQALEQQLVRTTTIRSAGVDELRGDTARLLVILDQQTLRTETNEQTSSAAVLDVVATRSGGEWKIASLAAR